MKHASLFSGIGGPEVAAAMLGWENAFHCEINPFGLAVPPMPGPPTYGKGDPKRYPFSKWRTESLKAYGNAIVPQVMYRIFQAIEQATHEKDNV